jgi:hypothetical protein
MPWQTAHADHAIERVSLSFVLSEPVSSKPWQLMLNEATPSLVARGFSAVEEVEIGLHTPGAAQPLAQFMIGPGGVIAGPGAGVGPTGRSFQLADAGQLREQLGLHRNRVTYITTLYNGWDEAARFGVHAAPARPKAVALEFAVADLDLCAKHLAASGVEARPGASGIAIVPDAACGVALTMVQVGAAAASGEN